MESIGEKLKTAREQSGYSLDQIARDTNITKHYLVALEAEDFNTFAGETYIVGFLRTYAEYLGLSPDELITLYRNFKIQEQPIPLNELLDKGTRKPTAFIVIILVVIIAGLGTGGYFLAPKIGAMVAAGRAARQEAKTRGVTGIVYEMKDEILERRFSAGDEIVLIQDGKRFGLVLKDVADKLVIQTPLGAIEMKLGEEKLLDLNADNKDDIKLFLRDIDISDRGNTVVMRLDRFTMSERTGAEVLAGKEETSELYAPGAEGAGSPAAGRTAAGTLRPQGFGQPHPGRDQIRHTLISFDPSEEKHVRLIRYAIGQPVELLHPGATQKQVQQRRVRDSVRVHTAFQQALPVTLPVNENVPRIAHYGAIPQIK